MRTVAAVVILLVFILDLSAREETRLDSDWRFMRGAPPGVAGQAMSPADANWIDSSWQAISIPHSWGWEDAQQGKNYYRGPGWYRRELTIQPQNGKRYFLRFEAAGSVADVYLNGKLLGQHRGAFGAFAYEITRGLSRNGTNLLAVRVSNAAEPDIAPLSGDFCVFGGLYRPVHLIETGEENFTLTDHGSPGVAWLQTSVTKSQATVDIKAQISNGTRRNQSLKFVASVLDASGKRIATGEQPIVLMSNVTAPFSLRVVVPEPHLWNGRQDPYLYRAIVELRSTDTLVDSVEQPLGLRFYSIDPDKGFFLNGEPYHLHGVNRHQDRPDKGWALTEADQDEDIRLIQEIGATVVRCAHYQHSDYFYSLCDKAGILVWAEIPQVDKIGGDEMFAETSRSQLLDLIRQNINHPAIFTWSLFNELRPGNPDPHRELQDLNLLAHGEDPTRPTIAATCVETLPQMNQIPDLLGYNIYPGWYDGWGTKDDFGPLLDRSRTMSQHGGLCVSEYGAGANVLQHQENMQAPPKTTGQWHPEEWQCILHESAWGAMKARPFVWGTFLWNMFDFTSYWRHEGGIPGRNDKGLVTYDRAIKKDAFYFYKANWSEEPTLYITSRRYTERTNAVTDVKIYSNAKNVELLLNGTSLGNHANGTNGVFVWKAVQLKPGENRIAARAELRGQKLTDECVWQLRAAP
jgi:beta-galactosidase